jgi:hypothetical protein
MKRVLNRLNMRSYRHFDLGVRTEHTGFADLSIRLLLPAFERAIAPDRTPQQFTPLFPVSDTTAGLVVVLLSCVSVVNISSTEYAEGLDRAHQDMLVWMRNLQMGPG